MVKRRLILLAVYLLVLPAVLIAYMFWIKLRRKSVISVKILMSFLNEYRQQTLSFFLMTEYLLGNNFLSAMLAVVFPDFLPG